MTSPLRFLIQYINRHTGLFIITPPDFTIGNSAEELYFGFLYARANKKKILVLRRFSFFGFLRISNREIFNLKSDESVTFFSRELQFLGNITLTVFFGFLPAVFNYVKINGRQTLIFLPKILSYILNGDGLGRPRLGRHSFKTLFEYSGVGSDVIWNRNNLRTFSWEAASKIPWEQELNSPLIVSFAPRKQAAAEKLRIKMGLSKEQWYVCFHVREGGYHKDRNAHRNSDIANSMEAMKAVVRRGGMVVRMGDPTMKRLPPMKGVIDYPFTEFKSELMDLYLIKNCRLYVGANSGILDCAILFQKRMVIINSCEWSLAFPQHKNDLAIMKHVYSRKLDRFLSLRELLVAPFSWQDLHVYGRDTLFFENTPQEILDVVSEALDQDEKYSYTELQDEFTRGRNEQMRRWLTGPPLWPTPAEDCWGKFRYASRAMNSRGTLGRKFLSENWEKDQFSLDISK